MGQKLERKRENTHLQEGDDVVQDEPGSEAVDQASGTRGVRPDEAPKDGECASVGHDDPKKRSAEVGPVADDVGHHGGQVAMSQLELIRAEESRGR